ncbi:MAG: PorV/PorQ family protein [Calditrichaeota bacterium]|nr:PorV/PorQ family protein [Calditrichota bacterium]
MQKIIGIVLTFILWSSTYIWAQGIAKVGTAGYQFLKIGVGARGVALGNAVDPMINDASAMFWNPATLNFVENASLFLNHSEYLADMRFEGFAFAKKINRVGVVGVNLVYLDSGPIEETTEFQQNGTGNTFSAVSYSIGISFARMLTEQFGVGGTVKYVSEDLTSGLGEDNRTGAWAVDIGTVYFPGFTLFPSLRMTMAIRNFGPEVRLKGTYYDFNGIKGVFEDYPSEYKYFPLPLTFRFGIGYDPIDRENQKLTIAVYGEHPNDNLERVNMGAEYIFNNIIALRGGYILNHDTRTFSAGVGFNIGLFGNSRLKIDYAYAHYGVLEDVQVFSFVFDW